jgi:putative phosphoribosyl transferase
LKHQENRACFRNRQEAGKKLASHLKELKLKNPVIIALPRGGVPIGAEIAKELHAELDVLNVRKVGAPGNPEYGIGAITEGGLYWLNDQTIEALRISPKTIKPLLDHELNEVNRRISTYRHDRPLTDLTDKTVILVDDGLATGVTALVAIQYLEQQAVREIIFAVPVCARDSAKIIKSQVNRMICLEQPERLYAVGLWYEDFSQLSDLEVTQLLNQFSKRKKTSHPSLDASKLRTEAVTLEIDEEIQISEGLIQLPGHICLPSPCSGIVLFAHGSGSSRLSPRNQEVARILNQHQIATLLFDLLSPTEANDRTRVFDIPFLAKRLILATRWIQRQSWYHQSIPLGYFGASTGGGAALWAAAELGYEVSAVVSRGGRPDLALPRLREVIAPTLLIVGGYDEEVIDMNEYALDFLTNGQVIIIPNATHLFEEPGTLEAVALHAAHWFKSHFRSRETKPSKQVA